jgi:hypothetical protein
VRSSDKNMHDSLWYMLGIIAFVNWYLYVFETLSKIRKYRTIYLSDWGFSAFKPLKNLNEYKEICERENESLVWYKIQIFLLFSFICIGAIWVLLP